MGGQYEEGEKRKGKKLRMKGQEYNLHVELGYKKEKIEDSRGTLSSIVRRKGDIKG